MGLSVNNNTAAYNTYRNLTTTQSQLSKSLEKLSSGYRINRAADDAAGLAISEGLRSQIQGLTQATRNSQDAINVVQTAEGALSESTSILQRMRTLAVQASSTGSINDDAKANIQAEVVQLKSELDRISTTTKFNGKALLDGTFNSTFQVGANANETISVNTGGAMNASGLGISGVDMTTTGNYVSGSSGAGTVLAANATASASASLTITAQGTDAFYATGSFTESTAVASYKSLTGSITFGGKTLDLGSVDYGTAATGTTALAKLNAAAQTALGLTGSGSFTTNAAGTGLTFAVREAVSGFTGTNGVAKSGSAADIDNATPIFTAASGASAAISLLDKAIKTVSTTRANLGAVQNRLEHTIANLGTATENLTASESSIRDVDMASEMTKFTSKQILAQAGTAMLAQAKNLPQSVLSLLQG